MSVDFVLTPVVGKDSKQALKEGQNFQKKQVCRMFECFREMPLLDEHDVL